MKRTLRIIVPLLVFLYRTGYCVDLPDDTAWQNPDNGPQYAGKTYFRGRPLPQCKAFWILEEHFEQRLSGQNDNGGPDDLALSFDIGHMFNLSRHQALGGSIFINANDNRDDLGIRFRHRYWITRELAWDLAPGIIMTNDLDSPGERFKFPGFSAATYLYCHDWVALNLTFETYKTTAIDSRQTGRTVTSLYGGATLGSYPAAAGIAATIIFLILSIHDQVVY